MNLKHGHFVCYTFLHYNTVISINQVIFTTDGCVKFLHNIPLSIVGRNQEIKGMNAFWHSPGMNHGACHTRMLL